MKDDDSRPRLPDPRMIPAAALKSWSVPHVPSEAGSAQPKPEPGQTDTAEEDVFLRPFIVTGGRTTPLLDGLRIETLVQAAPAALSAPLRFEERAAVQLCQQPRSVAEIAATLGVLLGVAKVIVGDLVTAGYAAVREPDELQIAAIERIRDLVRAL